MGDDPTPHLERFGGYEVACREFRWRIPDTFNIADAILSQHADGVTRVALLEARSGGLNTYTYGGLDYLSDKFATALSQQGVAEGDSIAVVLPQSAANLIAQLGVLKLGGVVVPLSIELEASALAFAIRDSGTRTVVIHHSLHERLRAIASLVDAVFVVNRLKPEFEDIAPDFDFWHQVFEASADFTFVATPARSPAFIFYVADQAGQLVRTTHSHDSLIYQLPAFEMCNNFQLGEDTVLWTPQDWSSVGSSLSSIYPALWYGCRLAASEARVKGEDMWRLVERCGITNLFVNPVELEGLRESRQSTLSPADVQLRNIVSGEGVPPGVRNWVEKTLGASVNTVYCNALSGSAAASCVGWYETPPGSVGRAASGYSIEIVDEHGSVLPARTKGRLAIRRTGLSAELPVTKPSRTSDRNADLFVSGDVGFRDEEGYVFRAIGC